MKQGWNGRAFGGPQVFSGNVKALADDGTTLTFRVAEGNVIRTFTMAKADARITVSATDGISITDTEAKSHA